MTKGGKRSTSFKPTWNLGKTKLVRIPVVILDEIVIHAKCLDNGKDYEREIILAAINKYIESQLSQSGGNQHKKKGEVVNVESSRDWKHLLKFKKFIQGALLIALANNSLGTLLLIAWHPNLVIR